MQENMFYKANPLIFRKAEELRHNPTFSEELLWNYLKTNRFGIKFRRQHPAFLYVLDFYSHKIKLAIEVDGDIHSLEDVKRNDKERQIHLESLGIQFLRFSTIEIEKEIDQVMNKIDSVIKSLLQNKNVIKNSPLGAEGLEIIPAIDIIDGKCVRLTKGDYDQKKIYNENPVEVAKQFEDAGLKRLHLVDLDGAKEGRVRNWKVLESIAGKTSLVIDFGGGIKTEKDVTIVFDSGAALATVGSVAVKNEMDFLNWITIFGPDNFFLGADVKNEKIAVNAWSETTEIWVYDFIQKYMEHGIKQIFCTDTSKDGMLEGPSIDLYKTIVQQFPALHFIASGGVSSMKDLEELKKIGCRGVIVGKAIYENRISLNDLKKVNNQ